MILIKRLKNLFRRNTIADLEIDKINESHLISLENGFTMYRRAEENPLEFRYNNTTFTTEVLLENRRRDLIATNSGNCCMISTVKGAFAETRGRENRKLYKIIVIKPINRILDLDKVCEEQKIRKYYLNVCDTPDGRDHEKEKELFRLYGKQIHERRIHGVKYQSRRSQNDTCYMFYDTLANPNEYFRYEEMKAQEDAFDFIKVSGDRSIFP